MARLFADGAGEAVAAISEDVGGLQHGDRLGDEGPDGVFELIGAGDPVVAPELDVEPAGVSRVVEPRGAQLQPVDPAQRFDGAFDLAGDPAEGGFVVQDGYMRLLDEPGLGVSLRP